jgi:hypothetical protein
MSVFKRILAFFVAWLNRQRDPKDHALSDFDKTRYEVRPGDVILVEGRSTVGRKLRTITISRWTHSALYIGRPLDIEDADLRNILSNFITVANDTPLIIETRIGAGVTVRPLLDLEHDHLRICRPKGLAHKDVQQAIRYAVNHLGNYNEGTQLMDLTRFLFPWGLLPSSWRLPLFRRWPGRHTKNVSASFIAETFGFIQFPIYPLVKISTEQGTQLLRRHPRLCMPFEIDMSPNFEIVKYPFLDFRQYENERLIPWKGSGLYSGVEQEPALTFQRSAPLRPVSSESPDAQSIVVNLGMKDGG